MSGENLTADDDLPDLDAQRIAAALAVPPITVPILLPTACPNGWASGPRELEAISPPMTSPALAPPTAPAATQSDATATSVPAATTFPRIEVEAVVALGDKVP